jgi:hypothetical protein
MPDTIERVSYADAETRGRLRMWKQKLARDYATFRAAWRELPRSRLPDNLVNGTGSARKTALRKIHRALGPGVTLERADLDTRHRSMALWSILKPRSSVTVYTDYESESERASLAQDCVTVNYMLLANIEGEVRLCAGLWTLEVPDHALGRAVERSRFLHPGTIIRDAHLTLLDLPVSVIEQGRLAGPATSTYIKAGAGCFAAQFRVGRDVSLDNEYAASVRVRTWLSDGQLYEQQIVLSEKGEPGLRLGDNWLRPAHLRRSEQAEEKQVRVFPWQPHHDQH